MDANKDVILRKAKRQEASSNLSNLSDNLYECAKGTEAINKGTAYNLIPIRRWMRDHYTKLTSNNEARCNHCYVKFNVYPSRLRTLHEHLVEAHPDKLAEEEKNEVKFYWLWDYYIVKSNTEAICKLCKITVRYKRVNHLKPHLKRYHEISGPTSDIVIDNGNSSDDDMDANKDITLRKAKSQEASFDSTNLSDNLYECAKETEAINDGAPYSLIPIRRWMREHYTKLTRNRARCNHCNEKFNIYISRLYTFHKHLVEAHPDKLAEEENKEVKFHWAWDYYIIKSNTEAECKLCKVTVRYMGGSNLIKHLKIHHEILGPTSDNVIDNESSSDDNMNVNKDITLRKAKSQEASSNSTNLSDNLYECAEETEAINVGAPYSLIPIRRWMREHYTKLTRNRARCNHCNEKFNIYINRLYTFHKHLVKAHPDKLAEEEKKEVKFHWPWDYYTPKDNRQATCIRCKRIVTCKSIVLIGHLKRIHKISGPTSNDVINNVSSSDDDMDANKDITLRKAKRQEASFDSTNLSDNLYECAEGTEAINDGAPCSLIPIRRWMRIHYTKLTRNRARCNHCNEKFNIYINRLYTFHKHLVKAHPDKLAEEEKKEVKFHWTWDYYTPKDNTKAECKECKKIIKYHCATHLKLHLKIHMIFGPGSNNHMNNENNSSNYVDADRNTIIKNAKYQEDLSKSTGSCNNSLYEKTGGTEDLNEFVPSASNSMNHIMESLSDTDSTEYVKSSNSDDDLSFDEIFDLLRQE